jgi:hypothetical protein
LIEGRTISRRSRSDRAGFVREEMNSMALEGPAVERKPCPYCDEPLATDKARQCFRCGMDWHDPAHVVRRGVPGWNRFGLVADRSYVVELCQEGGGRRYTTYRELDAGEHDRHCVLETQPAPGWQLIEWGFHAYAEHLRLTTGERFGFDPHGIWLTERELEYLRRRSWGELAGDEPPAWVNGIPPRFPPA